MGKAVGRARKSKAQRLADAIAACDQHLTGVPLYEIATGFGVSVRTIQRWIEWAMSLRADPTVDQYRAEAVARINRSRRNLNTALDLIPKAARVLEDPATGERVVVVPDLSLVPRITDSLTKLDDQEAKLRGAFAPTRVDVTVQERDAWASLEAELARVAAATPAPPVEVSS